VPSAISSLQKSRFIVKARDARERFAQDALRWLSTLSFIHYLHFFQLICTMFHAQGDSELSDVSESSLSPLGLSILRNQEGLGEMYDAVWKCWHIHPIGNI
jgi:hypothetical protein